MSNTPRTPAPQAPRAHPFQIRLDRAVLLIARYHLDTRTACRAVGLRSEVSALEVRRLCDERGIPRRHGWGRPLPIWKTAEPGTSYVPPRAPP
jgi:hypothetical protein